MWLSASVREGRWRAKRDWGAVEHREWERADEWIGWDTLGFCYFGQTVRFAPFFFNRPVQRQYSVFQLIQRVSGMKKKKGHGTDAQAAASDSGSAAILPRWCIIDQHYLVAVDALMGISNFQLLCIFLNIPKDMGINMTFLLKALQGPFIVQIFLK